MVNQYETVFIATPVLSDAQMKEAVAKYVKLRLPSTSSSSPTTVARLCTRKIGACVSLLTPSSTRPQVFIT